MPPVPTSYLTNDLDPAVCDLLNKSSETPVVLKAFKAVPLLAKKILKLQVFI